MSSATPPREASAYTIRSVDRVCDILDLLSESADGVSLADVAKTTELPKSSAFRYLVTLEARRYVERSPVDGNFRLGLAINGLQARDLERLVQRARPDLERLRDEFGETVNLGRLDGARVAYIDIVESPQAMRLAARPGDRAYLHSTALGKVIGAQLPEDRVRAILAQEGMPSFTPRTVTNADELLKAIAQIRRRGYAVDEGENEPGARCVAVGIPGRPEVAVSMSAPAARLVRQAVPDVARRLAEVASDLSAQDL